MLSSIKQFLNQPHNVPHQQWSPIIEKVKNSRAVSLNDIRNELRMKFIDLPELRDAVVTILPV